jgi:ATP-binding cassette subfamily B protein
MSAIKAAQAGEFISSLDAPVTRGGANFSGGQKQRLSIARALAGSPLLLIFDDSSSALDYSTELKLRRELNKLKNTTKVIITQRASSVKNAQHIIVLEEGVPVGGGTHEELLASCRIYQEICQIQGIE